MAVNTDPMMKIIARSISVLFRPSASFIGPAQSAPMMAPINPALTAISSCVPLRWKSFWIKSMAPEITPVL